MFDAQATCDVSIYKAYCKGTEYSRIPVGLCAPVAVAPYVQFKFLLEINFRIFHCTLLPTEIQIYRISRCTHRLYYYHLFEVFA